MPKRKTMKVRITTDAKKLWSCSNMVLGPNRDRKGELPKSAGKEIEVYMPGETPSTICKGTSSWLVAKVAPGMRPPAGARVCNHQVDLPKED